MSTCIDGVLGCSAAGPVLDVNARLFSATHIRFSEIISALSVALDITQGHPQGHCMRSALIGMRLAEQIALPTVDRSALFYALLLKDLGCSSNAAKIAYLFGSDDHAIKRSARLIDWTSSAKCLNHCWTNCSPGSSTVERLLKVASIVRLGPKVGRQIAEIRCERGAEIARMLKLPESVATAIYELDEHWNGRGNPCGLKGQEISLLGRICCLSQTVEVFFSAHGLQSAIDVCRQRRAQWFDPELVDALIAFKHDADFWATLGGQEVMHQLSQWEPEDLVMLADEACLDRVSEAFALVVDAKSPWTYQHSTRVAEISVGVAAQFGCAPEVLRDIRRAALLHDIGKLGVSNAVLDKPGKPTEAEFAQIRKHPDYTHRILSRVDAFRTLADVAAAHHERLDGRGYHLRLDGSSIPWISRVLMVADICEAMSAKRPYRDSLSWEQIQQVMSKDAGTGVDPECFAALEKYQSHCELTSRVEAQLDQVDRMLSGT